MPEDDALRPGAPNRVSDRGGSGSAPRREHRRDPEPPFVPDRTLYLGWEDRSRGNDWFPIGRLDVVLEPLRLRFRHLKGAELARATGGFHIAPGFGDLRGDYYSTELFPTFHNRVMSRRRPDFEEYVSQLDLDPSAHFTERLAVDGGRRMTDTFEVFPKLIEADDGFYTCRFFARGFHHLDPRAQERIETLRPGDRLHVALEPTNSTGHPAVGIRTTDDHIIGWAPRYFVHELVKAKARSDGTYDARVARMNPLPAPSEQRVLVEMRSRWERHEPMSGPEFEPLVG